MMRKVLLSSSQVSILASALVVILCTSALFMSGYAIQQRTLRDLREAIRPRDAPRAFLPEPFKRQTITAEEGTVMAPESESSASGREPPHQPRGLEQQPGEEQQAETGGGEKPTSGASPKQMEMMEQIKAQAARKSWAVENPDSASKNRAPVSRAQRRKMIQDELQRVALRSEKQPVFYQRRLW